MYKISYIPTGHIFEIPDADAKILKRDFPNDYKILEKNGKRVRDYVKKKVKPDDGTIYSKVVEEDRKI